MSGTKKCGRDKKRDSLDGESRRPEVCLKPALAGVAGWTFAPHTVQRCNTDSKFNVQRLPTWRCEALYLHPHCPMSTGYVAKADQIMQGYDAIFFGTTAQPIAYIISSRAERNKVQIREPNIFRRQPRHGVGSGAYCPVSVT